MGAQISTNLSSCCSSNIKSKADLGRYIKNANKSTLMVINFTTTWCQLCIDAEPYMRKLAEEFPDVKFARVDIDLLLKDHTNAPLKAVSGDDSQAVSGDDSQDVVTEFDLKKIPTFLLCRKVDDGLDKGKGAAEAGGSNGSGNRISSANNVKEGNSVVPSAIEDKRSTSIKGGNSVVPSATEGKSADSVKEGSRAVPGAPGGKSSTGVERANSAAVGGSKGESTTANANEGQTTALAPNGKNATSTVKEGSSVSTKINSVKNGDGVTGVKDGNSVPSPKRRTVNYAGKKVSIDEIDRMEGPLKVHELRKKITRVNGVRSEKEIIPASFKSTDELYRYLEKSKPTQLMVINFGKKADEPFKKLPNDFKDVKFAKVDVDVDDLMNIAKELDVTMKPAQPTFLLVKVKKLEKEHVKNDGVQGDQKDKKEPPEKDYVKKDGVQGDHNEKKEPPVLNGRYKVVKFAQVVGWDDNKERELSGIIEKNRCTTT